jgi:hypothetical protein
MYIIMHPLSCFSVISLIRTSDAHIASHRLMKRSVRRIHHRLDERVSAALIVSFPSNLQKQVSVKKELQINP